MGELGITSFSTSHDAADSVGYRISDERKTAVIATDLGRVTSIVLDAVFGADLALIEANHDEDWLRTGPYPYALQNRILGDRGHLSNEASAEFAVSLAAAGTQTLLFSPSESGEQFAGTCPYRGTDRLRAGPFETNPGGAAQRSVLRTLYRLSRWRYAEYYRDLCGKIKGEVL